MTVIDSIAASQQAEQELIAQLDKLTGMTGYTIDANATAIIDTINSLSDSRIALFASISNNADIVQSGVANSRTDLISQITLLKTVEDQLTQAKNTANASNNYRDTQLRLVEINTYYGKRYAAQSKLMKMIILICIPLLILFVLKKKGWVPEMISNYAIGITIAVGAFFVVRAIWDISSRSNINFDEYNWNYESPSAQIPSIWQYNKENAFNFDNPIKNLMGNLGLCVGSTCCANGMYFDTSLQKCTSTPSASTTLVSQKFNTTESFICGGNLNGTAVVPIDDKEEEQNGISPFSATSSYAQVQ